MHAAAPTALWTCPFCALLCDDIALDAQARPPTGLCPRASAAWAGLQAEGRAMVDGQPVPPAQALATAARRLAQWRQPLLGGLGTDIAGARALYRLAARCGAIADHADGEALFAVLRALQDRGQYTATLADVRQHARLLLCLGTDARAYPRLWQRLGLGLPGSPCTQVLFLGVPPAPLPAGVQALALGGSGQLPTDLQGLALALQRPGRGGAMAALAQQLQASPYSVLILEPGTLAAPGAPLVVEAVQHIVGLLNQRTRAASLLLGGSDGAASANQTFTWLGGLPLRSRIAATGIAHEPQRHATQRLLQGGAVDGLLWVMSGRADRLPPPDSAALPRVVLGPPAMASALRAQGAAQEVFIPVATPGVNAVGHAFRLDGPIVMPLMPLRPMLPAQAGAAAPLPGVAEVADALRAALEVPA